MINQSYTTSRRNVKDTWDFIRNITPLDVLEYFKASPILTQYADDLAKAPLFASETHQNGSQVDLQAQRDAEAIEREFGANAGPSLANVAELLTGKRQYGGGVYYRLKKALAAYELLTTSPEEEPAPPENPNTARLAA